MMFFSCKQNDIEIIGDNNEAIKLNKINDTMNVKRILSVNDKHELCRSIQEYKGGFPKVVLG